MNCEMPKSYRCMNRCQYALDVGLASNGLFPGGGGWSEGYSCHHECQYIDDDLNEVNPWTAKDQNA